MNLFPDGSCTDAQRQVMCRDVYMGRLDCHKTGTGDIGGMNPMRLTELNVTNSADFVARQYQLRNLGTRPDNGFGFAFCEPSTRDVHKARVLCIDYSKWTIRHFVHFLCKYPFLFEDQHILKSPFSGF